MRWVTFCVVASVAVALDAGLLEAFRSGDADGDARLDAAEFQAALASLYVAQAKAGTPTAPAAASQYLQAAKNAPAGDAGFYRAFVNSLGMIWATEVGDKTSDAASANRALTDQKLPERPPTVFSRRDVSN